MSVDKYVNEIKQLHDSIQEKEKNARHRIEDFFEHYFKYNYDNIDHISIFKAISSFIDEKPDIFFTVRLVKFSTKKMLALHDNIISHINLYFDLLSYKVYLSEIEDLSNHHQSLSESTIREIVKYLGTYSKKLTIYDAIKFKRGKQSPFYYGIIFNDCLNSHTYIPDEIQLLEDIYNSKDDYTIKIYTRELFRALTVSYNIKYHTFTNLRYKKILGCRKMIFDALTNKIIKKVQLTTNPDEETDPNELKPLKQIKVFDSFYKTITPLDDEFVKKIKRDIRRKLRDDILYKSPAFYHDQTHRTLYETLDSNIRNYFYYRNPNPETRIFNNGDYQAKFISYLKHASIENYFVARYYKQILKTCHKEYQHMIHQLFKFLYVITTKQISTQDTFEGGKCYIGPDIIPLAITCYFPAPIYQFIYNFSTVIIRYSQWELRLIHHILALQMTQLLAKNKQLKAPYSFCKKIAKYII